MVPLSLMPTDQPTLSTSPLESINLAFSVSEVQVTTPSPLVGSTNT